MREVCAPKAFCTMNATAFSFVFQDILSKPVLSDQTHQSLVGRKIGEARDGSCSKSLPFGQVGRAMKLVGQTIDQMALSVEVIVDYVVDGSELLQG